MKKFCVKITLPIIEANSADELADEIGEALIPIGEKCPLISVQCKEFKDDIIDELLSKGVLEYD